MMRAIAEPTPGSEPMSLLLVPSLVNRWWIMDATPELGFAGYMAQKGWPVAVLDWDAPGEEETGFAIGDYVTKRLIPAVETLQKQWGRPVALVGYCMGGLMAM